MTLRPGSFLAYRQGCKCSMIDNQFGLGADTSGQSEHYIINKECKLHADGYRATLAQTFAKRALDKRRGYTDIATIKADWEKYQRDHANLGGTTE